MPRKPQHIKYSLRSIRLGPSAAGYLHYTRGAIYNSSTVFYCPADESYSILLALVYASLQLAAVFRSLETIPPSDPSHCPPPQLAGCPKCTCIHINVAFAKVHNLALGHIELHWPAVDYV